MWGWFILNSKNICISIILIKITTNSFSLMIYVNVIGFKNFRYNTLFPSRINLNPRKLTVFDFVISDMPILPYLVNKELLNNVNPSLLQILWIYFMDKNKDLEDVNLATIRNEDWWRLEKSQFGRKKLP